VKFDSVEITSANKKRINLEFLRFLQLENSMYFYNFATFSAYKAYKPLTFNRKIKKFLQVKPVCGSHSEECVQFYNFVNLSTDNKQVCLEFSRFLQKKLFYYFDNSHKINTFVLACTLIVSAYEQWQNISKTNCPQQGVWRQAGRCLVGHFA